MHPHKHILILSGRNTSVEMLEGLPIDITLFQTEDRVTSLQHRLCKRVIVTDLYDREEIIRHASAIHQYHPFDAVVSFLEDFLITAALICEKLGIRGNPLRPVELTIDKIKMRQVMEQHGLPTVRFRRCHTLEDIRAVAQEISGPFILKPVNGSGSMRVALIESTNHIEDAWRWASSHNEVLIAEEYIEGREFSVEGLSHHGRHRILAVTEKETTGAPHFIETGHRQPASLPLAVAQRMEEVVVSFLDVIGQQEGPSHTEIRIRNGVPYIIESHTRYGGDRIWEMVYLTQGIHIQQTTVCQMLEISVPENRPHYPAAAIKFLTVEPKICTSIHGVAVVQEKPATAQFA